jgi:hypothetical protein
LVSRYKGSGFRVTKIRGILERVLSKIFGSKGERSNKEMEKTV